MKAAPWTHSFKTQIVVSYSFILILGGLSTSIIGIVITNQALFQQAKRQIVFGLSTARSIYVHRQQELRQSVELLATSGRLEEALAAGQPSAAHDYLTEIRYERQLDFMSVIDTNRKVILRTSGARLTGDSVAEFGPIEEALNGRSAVGTEIIPQSFLSAENPALVDRSRIELINTRQARVTSEHELVDGMAFLAAAPVRDEVGEIVAVVYAGQLILDTNTDPKLTSPKSVVDQINSAIAPDKKSRQETGTISTIFQDDVRVATNLALRKNVRAVGTRAPKKVYESVINDGESWIGRSYVVTDWYIVAYEPIRNLAGKRIGMLAVGVLQSPYTKVRNQVTITFAVIALLCFVLIVVVTYFLTRSLVRPLEEMVAVSHSISTGDFSRRVNVTDRSEFGLVASSFNEMLDHITVMTQELEQWAKTLEEKVEQRSVELVKVQEQAARQQRLASVGQLAAGVAHEINNPLGGILTFASVVLEELPADSPLRKDVEEIHNQAIRCRKIVSELLEFSRGRDSEMAPADIDEVLSRTLALIEHQALFQNINIERHSEPNIPLVVMDESQMQQVFVNIVLNAVHAMKERGTLTINAGLDPEGDYVSVRIKDTGCGIPAEIQEAIFDPFFTTKDPGQGTGLGLAVAARIVQVHGGRLEVESRIDVGTTFVVSLPTGS